MRHLPPHTFHTKVPRVSRSFRLAQSTALPGCDQGQIGVACDVILRTDDSNRRMHFDFEDPVFRIVQGDQTQSVWASCSATVYLDVVTVAQWPIDSDVFESRVVDTIVRLGKTHNSRPRPPPPARLRLAVSSTQLGAEYSVINLSGLAFGALLRLSDFVYKRGVTKFVMGNPREANILTELPLSLNMPSVKDLESLEGGDVFDPEPDMDVAVHVGRLTALARFPSASRLQGTAFYPLIMESPEDLVNQHISPTQRNVVTSLLVPQLGFLQRNFPSYPYKLLRSTLAYSNLVELGVLSFWTGSSAWYNLVDPNAKPLVPLLQLRILHLRVHTFDLESAPRASCIEDLVQTLFRLVPKPSRVTVQPLAKLPHPPSTEPLGTFLNGVVKAVPAHCRIDLRAMRLSVQWSESATQSWIGGLSSWDGRRDISVYGLGYSV
ncbi:hypothetical protein HDU93_009385 [Gonapodya sp. JEL0774]|nr:hypothetical protein HDU93_009385 [Gonapodya sp. JEL0774]